MYNYFLKLSIVINFKSLIIFFLNVNDKHVNVLIDLNKFFFNFTTPSNNFKVFNVGKLLNESSSIINFCDALLIINVVILNKCE